MNPFRILEFLGLVAFGIVLLWVYTLCNHSGKFRQSLRKVRFRNEEIEPLSDDIEDQRPVSHPPHTEEKKKKRCQPKSAATKTNSRL